MLFNFQILDLSCGFCLGAFEHFRATLHELSYHNNVCLLATYTNVNLTRHRLIHALEQTIRQHPALSVQVTSAELARPYFVQLQSIDLDKVIEFVDLPGIGDERATRVDEILSAQHSLGFYNKEEPLWRVLVLNYKDLDGKISVFKTDIAFIWHHVIGDGKSGLAVHNTILQALKSPYCHLTCFSPVQGSESAQSDEKECPTKIIITRLHNELFPSLEQIFTMPASRSTFFNKLLGTWLGLYLRGRSPKQLEARKWSAAPYSDEIPINTLVRHIIIPKSSTKSLVALCNLNGTTITAFLLAIIAWVISVYYHRMSLRCATAISLRRFMEPKLGIGEQEMGLWVSAFYFNLEADELQGIDGKEESVWGLARRNSERIKQEIGKRDTDLGIGSLRYIPDFRQDLKAKIGKEREVSFGLTNLGVFNGKLITDGECENKDGIASIEKIIFSQSCHVNGSALQFHVISVRDEEMTIGVSWQEGIVSIRDAEYVTYALQAELIKFSKV